VVSKVNAINSRGERVHDVKHAIVACNDNQQALIGLLSLWKKQRPAVDASFKPDWKVLESLASLGIPGCKFKFAI